MKSIRTIVVMPAYNAAETLQKTISDIPFDYIDEIIVVDDASGDNTIEVARSIGLGHPRLTMTTQVTESGSDKILLSIERIEKNVGYGGNQKRCYSLALDHGADIVIMLHPDYQYDPKLIKHFVEFIGEGYFDVMLGTRIRSRKEALSGGMPRYKYYSNRMLSFIQNIASGLVLSEWHTGMRAYTRDVLIDMKYDSFSNDFIFDTQALFAIVENGYTIGDIPVPVKYFAEASSINFMRSARYGVLTLWETAKYLFRKHNQVARFLMVGVTGFLTNLGVYSLLLYGTEMWYVTSAILAFVCGAIVSFTLHKFWTFNNRSRGKVRYEVLFYVSIAIINILVNSHLLIIMVQNMMFGRLISNVISNAFVAVWSFFVYKYVVFRSARRQPGEA